MSKRVLGICVALAAVIVIVAFSYTRYFKKQHLSPDPASGLEVVRVRLKWLHQAQFAGFYTAKEKGFYRSRNIDVRLEPGGLDFPAIQMVSSGSDDFGMTDADRILLAREKGVPIVGIASIFRNSPLCYFALKRSGITKPQDFIGRRIGVKLGGNEELTFRAMMKGAGVDRSQVIEVPVKYDMTPLFLGQVDAWPGYSINEPLLAQEQGYELNYIWPGDYGADLGADVLFTTETMIRDKPDLIKRFVEATLEGWNYALEHQTEAIQFTLQQSDKLKESHQRAMLKASVELLKRDGKPIGWIDRKKWQEIHDLLLSSGFMKNPVDIDKALTTQFLGEVQLIGDRQ